MDINKHILIVDCGSSKVPDIINSVQGKNITCETAKITDLTNINLSNIDGIIISGAPILLTEINYHKYLNDLRFLFESEKPLLGICFGHQCLGLHYGAMVSKGVEDRNWQNITKIISSPLFEEMENTFSMMEDHCEEITIPNDFTVIAISDNCKNEAMQHQHRLQFGVQFHPEVSSEAGKVIFSNFIKMIKPKNT